jgi:hypothetical protein
MSEVTRILLAIEQGDQRAAGKLLPLVYDELRRLASRRLAGQQFRNLAEFSQLIWGQSRDIAGFAVFWFGSGAVTPISRSF